MEGIHLAETKKDWKYWTCFVFLIIGVVLTAVGVIGNFVAMGARFGYISLFSFVTNHWSFWVTLSGVITLLILYICVKFTKKS